MSRLVSWLSIRFTGRMSRREYFIGLIGVLFATPVILLLGIFIISIIVPALADSLIVLFVLGLFVTAATYYLSLGTRRLRDLAHSGWWQVVLLIPGINVLFQLWLLLAPGIPITSGPTTSDSVPLEKTTYSWLQTVNWVGVVIFGLLAWLLIISLNYDTTSTTFNDEDTIKLLEQLDPTLEPVVSGQTVDVFGVALPNLSEQLNRELPPTNKDVIPKAPATKDELFGVVVKIVCENASSYYFGSGTNISPTGVIVTNAHVIDEPDLRCIAGFPNPETGLIAEAYFVEEVIDDNRSTEHDLAVLMVTNPVTTENGDAYGYQSKLDQVALPYYKNSACQSEKPKLGSKVTILGYPVLTGGALTVTDGLISSLYSQDGYLITSAKISSGNSGGTALNENGCFVGVPTAVYLEDDAEQYGEIINANFVYDFLQSFTTTNIVKDSWSE